MIKTQWQLTALSGPTEGQTVVLSHKMSLGRAVAADIVVASPDVSRQHATLEVRPDYTLWVTDEHSSNGTLINDRRMDTEPQRLNSGDTLQFGQVLFKVFALEVNVADEASGSTSVPVHHAVETVVHEVKVSYPDVDAVDLPSAVVAKVPEHESSNPVATIDAAAIAGERILFQIKPDAPTEELLTAQDFYAEPPHQPIMSQTNSVALAEPETTPVIASTEHTGPAPSQVVTFSTVTEAPVAHVDISTHVDTPVHESPLTPPVAVDALPHIDTLKTTEPVNAVTVTTVPEPIENSTPEPIKPPMPEAAVHSAEPVADKPTTLVEPISSVNASQPAMPPVPDVPPIAQPVAPVIEPKPIAKPAPVVPTPNINTKTLPPVAPIQSPASLNAPKVAEAAGLPKGIIITIVFILIILAIVLWLFTGSH